MDAKHSIWRKVWNAKNIGVQIMGTKSVVTLWVNSVIYKQEKSSYYVQILFKVLKVNEIISNKIGNI